MVARDRMAVIVMLFASDPVGNFIDRNPTIRMLALAFIMLVGVVLMAKASTCTLRVAISTLRWRSRQRFEVLNLVAR